MKQSALLLAVMVLVGGFHSAQAQNGGQFCLRAFEDRNANGRLDGGEPFFTRGVSANLLNAENVVIASALLDNSPTAAQGVICFQFLPDGQYTMEITSADFTPTTPSSITASITSGTLPTVVEYGAQQVVETPVAGSTPQSDAFDQDMLQRMVLAALGTLVVLAGMTVLGALLYLAAFRPRRPARPYYAQPRATPSRAMPAVVLDDDDDIPPMPERTPTPGSVPLVDLLDDDDSVSEDTSEIRPV